MELEHLLSKVLVIDRATVHLVNSTWQDGLQVALELCECAVLNVTFPVDYRSRLFDQNLMCVLVRKQGSEKDMSHSATLNGVALLFTNV